jgi:RNA polymerase sigma-70 factor (ECF subfamily)
MTEKFYDTGYKTLFTAIAGGDEQAFKSLFDIFKEKTYAVAYKWAKSTYAAEEITQDVFVSIWISRQQLGNVNDPQAYLYTVIYNKVSQYLKKEANRASILEIIEYSSKVASNETEEMIAVHDSQRSLENAIAHLSPQRKIIFELNRKEGKSYNEIAETLHISRNTVKTHLAKALKFIQNYVRENALLLLFLAALLFFRQ